MLDFTLSEEQKMARDNTHEFAEKEIRPKALEYDEKEEFPWEIVKKANEAGLLHFNIPEEYGGPGVADPIMHYVMAEELAWGDGGIGVSITGAGLGSAPVAAIGTEEQKKKWLPRVVGPEPKLSAICITEPGAGSDVASISTTAKKVGNEYIINGTKQFVTNGGLAEFYTVFATSDKSLGYRGINAFIIDGHTPGVTLSKVEKKMGLRASQTAQVVFEDVKVPKEDLLAGEEGGGFYAAMNFFNTTRPAVGAMATGIARNAFEIALQYAKDRVQFGKPIIKHQAVGFMLADMATKIETARLLIYKAGWKLMQGQPDPGLSSMAKFYPSDMSVEVCLDAIQILGGYGYIREYGVEKCLRDAKVTQIFEGTNQIQRFVLSRVLDGMTTI